MPAMSSKGFNPVSEDEDEAATPSGEPEIKINDEEIK